MHVEDTGCGIEKEDLPNLFSGGINAEGLSGSEGFGFDVGLSITKKIIDSSGGHIHVQSDGAEKGSLFVFSIGMDHFFDVEHQANSSNMSRI